MMLPCLHKHCNFNLFSACCSLPNNGSTRLWVMEWEATKGLFSVMWSRLVFEVHWGLLIFNSYQVPPVLKTCYYIKIIHSSFNTLIFKHTHVPHKKWGIVKEGEWILPYHGQRYKTRNLNSQREDNTQKNKTMKCNIKVMSYSWLSTK